MAYRDNLRKASFRGVPFLVRTTDTDVGRRIVEHEYPLRDLPYVEDMGRRKREYSINGFVLGDDAIRQLENILNACEKAGAGTLIHPYFGTKEVTVRGCSSSQSMKEGREARFTFTFIEAGNSAFPSEEIDYESIIDASSSSILSDPAIAKTAFENNYNTTGQGFIRTSAVLDTTASYNMLSSIISAIPPQFTSESILSFLSDIDSAVNTIDAVVDTASDLADNIIDTIQGMSNLIPLEKNGTDTTINKLSTFNTAIELTRFGESSDSAINPEPSSYGGTLPSVIEISASTIQQRKNRESIIRLVRQVALTEAAKAAIIVDFDSYEQAADTRDIIANKINIHLESIGNSDIGDDDSYEAIDDLRAKTVKGIVQKGASLEKIINYSIPAMVLSSLALAYDRYEDLDREQEIIARNTSITNPGFLPAGNTIEILNG